jgi:signal transduction histidine kinase
MLGGGLSKFDRDTEQFIHYRADAQNADGLSNDLVPAILEDDEGALWFGTAGGLNRLDPQRQRFTHYRTKDGLPNDLILGILEDGNGDLWMSTNSGISRFDPQSETFVNYGVSDGLQSQEFNGLAYHQNSAGLLFFGGINGLNVISPSEIQDSPVIPQVVLTSLTQAGDVLEANVSDSIGEITLNWPGNFFELEFAALSYVDPDENEYAYMLEGFDETWNRIGNRRYGRYTNLPGGTYTLRLIGSNSVGVWNEQGYSLLITVVPPFWQARWFVAGIVLLFIGVVFVGVQLRVRGAERRSGELAKLVTHRTVELSHTNTLLEQEMAERKQTEEALAQRAAADAVLEERNRLARDLHDSVTQSLHGSTLLAEAGQRVAEAGDLERTKGYLTRLGEISQQALKEMRLLVFELRPLALDEGTLEEALRQRLNAIEQRAGIDVELAIDEPLDLPEAVEGALYRIAQEALNNALKHASPSSVVVSIHVAGEPPDRRVDLEVTDDGVGFDPSAPGDHGGVGLASMRERAENLGGNLAIRSSPDGGTRVKATLALRSAKSAVEEGAD